MESILFMRTVLDHRISLIFHKDFSYSLICPLQSEEILVSLINAQFELNSKLEMALQEIVIFVSSSPLVLKLLWHLLVH